MKAWVWRRRDSGVLLPAAEQVGDVHSPYELLVVEVTDQGRRRPMRVARLVPPGSRVAVAELVAPRLAWLRNDTFVLSGVDALARQGTTVHASQSWLCRFALPAKAVLFKVWTTHQEGVETPRRRLLSTGANLIGSTIDLASVLNAHLGRHTTQALVTRDSKPHLALLDCEIDWMSEERFCLGGLQHYPEGEQWPDRLLRQGWLCELDVTMPMTLPPGSERLRRKMSLR